MLICNVNILYILYYYKFKRMNEKLKEIIKNKQKTVVIMKRNKK